MAVVSRQDLGFQVLENYTATGTDNPPAQSLAVYHQSVTPGVKRFAVLSCGWTFIFLGVIGLFLPILQGVLFLLIGLIILSTEYAWAHHLLRKVRDRFPRLAGKADEASARAATWLRRFSGRQQ